VVRQPDRSLRADWGGAPVLVADGALAATGLVQPLSRVEYHYRVRTPQPAAAWRDAFIAADFHTDFETRSRKPELQPGDVLMFHNTVPHRSGRNPGPRHRYSIQVRFGDLLAPEVIARGWRNRRADGFEAFAALHPDLIASEEHP